MLILYCTIVCLPYACRYTWVFPVDSYWDILDLKYYSMMCIKFANCKLWQNFEGLQFFKYLNHKISHFKFSDVKTIKEKAKLMQPYSTFQNNACANMGPNFRNFKYLANR